MFSPLTPEGCNLSEEEFNQQYCTVQTAYRATQDESLKLPNGQTMGDYLRQRGLLTTPPAQTEKSGTEKKGAPPVATTK